MPAHAITGSLAASGNFTSDNLTTFQQRAGLIDDTVEQLGDLGDAAGNAGDGANDFSDGIDDLIEKSKQLFDFVELRLNWLDRNATRIANRFNEWMTDIEKSSNLKEQLGAITDQLEGSTRAAIAYAR